MPLSDLWFSEDGSPTEVVEAGKALRNHGVGGL